MDRASLGITAKQKLIAVEKKIQRLGISGR